MSKQLKIFKGRETCFNGYSKIIMSELQKMSEERQQTIQKKKHLERLKWDLCLKYHKEE